MSLADYNYKAPFPYFGGKSRVADLVWQRFGDVPNYVEPFFGSGAVLLRCPHVPQTETVNDADCYLANLWRALQHEPEQVALWADWPVNEADLVSRNRWFLTSEASEDFRKRMFTDPDYFDVKMAGWWVWGACAWIGRGWCKVDAEQLPHVGDAGMGIEKKLPFLSRVGQGITRSRFSNSDTSDSITTYFQVLSERLRRVRVACGDWSRVMGESVTIRHGLTAVFFDPPYGEKADCSKVYACENRTVAGDVNTWAVVNGNNPLFRIALCGYEGQYDMPDTWECVAWKASGGYGSQGNGRGRDNANRERIWFSPHCLKVGKEEPSLFDFIGSGDSVIEGKPE